MSSSVHRLRRAWVVVAVLVVALLAGQTVDLATASAAPGKQQERTQQDNKNKNKKKKKGKAKEKKKAGEKKKRKRAPRPITGYAVSAEGSYDLSVRESVSTPAAPYENKTMTVSWLATGSAAVSRSGTGRTFTITGAQLHGVLTGYGYDWNRGEKRKDYDFKTDVACTDSWVETVHGAPTISLGLSGSTADDLRVEVGRTGVPGTLVRAPSGPPICKHLTSGSFPASVWIVPHFSLPKTLSGPGALQCDSGGSFATGWQRSCSATTTIDASNGNVSYLETNIWTMSVKLTPVRGRSA
jgi:hypothetical protein